MIRINLLPVKEVKKYPEIRQELSIVVLSYVLISLIFLYTFISLNSQKNEFKKELQTVRTELQKYKDTEKKLARLKKEKEIVEKKIKIISNLEKERGKVIKILDILAKNFLADKMWLENLKLDGNKLHIKGIALGNEAVAEFMEKLKESKYFQTIELIKTVKKEIQGFNLTSFSLECKIRPVEKRV